MNAPLKRFRKWTAWLIVAVFGCTLLGYFAFKGPSRIPPSITIAGGLSETEATALYKFSNQRFREFYRRRALADLAAGQFKRAWAEIKNGPEQITTLAKQPDGHFLVQATNRSGFSASINYPCIPAVYTPWRSVAPSVLSQTLDAGYVKSPNLSASSGSIRPKRTLTPSPR